MKYTYFFTSQKNGNNLVFKASHVRYKFTAAKIYIRLTARPRAKANWSNYVALCVFLSFWVCRYDIFFIGMIG